MNIPFCIQSCSKPLSYALVQRDHNAEYVHKFVGHEPSGRSFNEITLNPQSKYKRIVDLNKIKMMDQKAILR